MSNPNVSQIQRWQSRIGAWLQRPLDHKIRSAAGKTRKIVYWLEDTIFEKRHGLDCRGYIEKDQLGNVYPEVLLHSQAYQAASCATIRNLILEAKKTGVVFDHFIDLGSGKGKACFYAARKCSFRKIIGIEFSRDLVEAADSNMRNFASIFGAYNIHFVHGDAAAYFLPTGNNLVFLFNPFDEFILSEFLEKNIDRFKESRSVIAYLNDKHRHCLAKAGFVTLYRNQDTQSSLHQYV